MPLVFKENVVGKVYLAGWLVVLIKRRVYIVAKVIVLWRVAVVRVRVLQVHAGEENRTPLTGMLSAGLTFDMAIIEGFVVGKVVVRDLHITVENVNGAALLRRIVSKQVAHDRRAARVFEVDGSSTHTP